MSIKIQNNLCEGLYSNLIQEVFVIKKAQNTEPLTYVTLDLNSEEIVGIFFKKEFAEDQRNKIQK